MQNIENNEYLKEEIASLRICYPQSYVYISYIDAPSGSPISKLWCYVMINNVLLGTVHAC